MIYVAMVFAWIAGISSVSPMVFVSTIVQDGVCLGFFVWESQLVKQIINYSVSFAYSLVPVILFVYCYSRIVVVMRRQMRVMAAHNVEGSAQMSASQLQSKRIKWNITKTMIIVSVAFVICWFPTFIYFLVFDNSSQTSSDLFVGYYATVFLSFLHACTCRYVATRNSQHYHGVLISPAHLYLDTYYSDTTPPCSCPLRTPVSLSVSIYTR